MKNGAQVFAVRYDSTLLRTSLLKRIASSRKKRASAGDSGVMRGGGTNVPSATRRSRLLQMHRSPAPLRAHSSGSGNSYLPSSCAYPAVMARPCGPQTSSAPHLTGTARPPRVYSYCLALSPRIRCRKNTVRSAHCAIRSSSKATCSFTLRTSARTSPRMRRAGATVASFAFFAASSLGLWCFSRSFIGSTLTPSGLAAALARSWRTTSGSGSITRSIHCVVTGNPIACERRGTMRDTSSGGVDTSSRRKRRHPHRTRLVWRSRLNHGIVRALTPLLRTGAAAAGFRKRAHFLKRVF